MMELARSKTPAARPWHAALDMIALVKPRIMAMALLTAAGGLSLAAGAPSLSIALTLLAGTALLVGAANTLNMYLERDIDCLMARTRNRPLPQQRLAPSTALVFGLVQAAIALPVLFRLDLVTGLLGVVALVSYVLLYTPLKQRTYWAVWVGAVPGAMPALMGWTAVTGRVELGGLAVFAVLFIWQVPHFHAIALFRAKEYERAGLKTLPGSRGELAARREIATHLVVQVAASLALYPLGVTGIWYLAFAVVGGAAILVQGFAGLRRTADEGPRWARQVFLASIVYLPVLFTAMVLDGRL
jgi:protoheme IX farnesyltransferase